MIPGAMAPTYRAAATRTFTEPEAARRERRRATAPNRTADRHDAGLAPDAGV
jgi:hypothetical protein